MKKRKGWKKQDADQHGSKEEWRWVLVSKQKIANNDVDVSTCE
jgi:hypothetical protein